ncbi:MAG: putative SOS response-associated peptidase YedK [Candidatus Aldehydirespiratoraceae bacterium]|jgi:putative SOS response-associated peptidase YedK
MCGRFAATTPPDQLAKYFGAQAPERLIEEREANYNVAPTQGVYTVFEDGGVRRLDAFHWGLVPFWAKDPKIGSRMINARAETIAEKNSFKGPFAKRRCIIPADGFYEWKKIVGQKKKQPMYMSRVDREPFAFAGLWEVWKDKNHSDVDGEPLELLSCTIITGEPNEKVAEVHDRMPVMLSPDAWDEWLDRDNHDTEALQGLLVPAPAQLIRIHPVSTEVNNVRHNTPALIEEAPLVADD